MGLVTAEARAQSRWVVPLRGETQLEGVLRAAAARGCSEKNSDEHFISFDCPQGKPPVPQALAAIRYFLHDSTTNDLIRADEVHAGSIPFGADGTGVRVAVIDSGFDTDHPAIEDAIADPNTDCINTTGDANGCEDLDGHGTAVSAIIAGIVTSGGPGITADSVAPGANIISIKVFPDDGSPIFSDDVAVAIQKAVDLGVDVINLSLGGGLSTSPDCDDSGDPAVDKINLVAAPAGVTVVISAGNDKSNDGVSFPACASQALAVGAVYQRNEGFVRWLGSCVDRKTSTDQVTCFSNSGPALDVVASGAFVLTAELGGGFDFFHGTSAAAPVVSGAAALLKHQEPSLTPAQLREALNNTALELGTGKNQKRNGNGRIDSVGAAQYVDDNFTLHPCTSNLDCDDGDLCNGSETCDVDTCVSGTPVSCDDGDVCTDDVCKPATGLCEHPDNGICSACVSLPKGQCNCDGKCTRKEAASGVCADCL